MPAPAKRPPFRFRFQPPWGRSGEARLVLPFGRTWLAILVVLAMAVAMTIPGVSVFQDAARGWARLETLFDLVGAVFSSAWLVGWSVGLSFLYGMAILMVFAREVLLIGRDGVWIRFEIAGLGGEMLFDPARISKLRLVEPGPKSGAAWRGRHLKFDYAGKSYDLGSKLDREQADRIIRLIEAAPRGAAAAAPVERERADRAAKKAEADSPRAAPAHPIGLDSPSTLSLIIANLVPVLGAIFLDWRLSDVMVLYWAESGVIGVYNVAKLVVALGWLGLGAGVLFLSHYSAFMAVHFLFIYGLFVTGLQGGGPGDSLAEVGAMLLDLWPAMAALFVSHGISFCVNFLGRREYQGRDTREQMWKPYRRIVLMHVTLIFGGFAVLLLRSATPVLLLLVLAKTMADVRAHLREHTGGRDDSRGRTGP